MGALLPPAPSACGNQQGVAKCLGVTPKEMSVWSEDAELSTSPEALPCAPDGAITRAPRRCSRCPGELRSLHWARGCKYPPAISLANHPCLEALHKPETDAVLQAAMLCAGVVLAAERREREEANPTLPHEGCPRPWLRGGGPSGPVVATEQGERNFSSVRAGAEGAGARGKSQDCSQQPQGQILGSVAASAGCLLVVLIVTGSFPLSEAGGCGIRLGSVFPPRQIPACFPATLGFQPLPVAPCISSEQLVLPCQREQHLK